MTGKHNPRSSSVAVARKTRMGFNLIEAAIVLGVVGLVIGGIWKAIGPIREKQQINQTVIDILYTVNNIRWLLSGNVAGYCSAIGCTHNINVTAQMVSFGVIPPEYTLATSANVPGFFSNNDVLKTPMGVDMLYVSGDWSYYGKIFGLKIVPVFINIDKPLCIKLIAAISSRFRDKTDLEWVESSTNDGNLVSFPIPLNTASTLCPPLSAGNNYLMFYFNAF